MSGRLSTFAAAMVIARRDFTAILFGRSFIFFLLGPLFPVIVAAMAGGVGKQVQQTAQMPVLGVVMSAQDMASLDKARSSLVNSAGLDLPILERIRSPGENEAVDAEQEWRIQRGRVSAVLTGTLEQPVMAGSKAKIEAWQGPVSIILAQAAGNGPRAYPEIGLVTVKPQQRMDRRAQLMTAQGAQTLLFLLTMLLAGMVLSNLVEEKGNKIIEILAAAIPMESVFFGKLFAMLAISFVGVGVWGAAGLGLYLAAGPSLPDIAEPAVGWPAFFALGVTYFAMAYLLIGSLFLSIGSMAATVREVQTISMPVTMMQLMVFFLASYAMTEPGSPIEIFAVVFPFSSPFAMLARAAQEPALWSHAAALAWQALCVVIFVRIGAKLFRTRVLKSGPAAVKDKRKGLFARLKLARR